MEDNRKYEEELKSEDMESKKIQEPVRDLKWHHGVITLVICLGILLFVSPILQWLLGLYGTLVGELLMLLTALLVVRLSGADFKSVFPLQKLNLPQTGGTLILWAASCAGVMALTMCMAYVFPNEVFGVSQQLNDYFMSVPLLLMFLIVGITPAVCEEAVFRGVFFHSLQKMKSKWGVILITGLIFGAFHTSLVRFVPTAILGIMMGYLMAETNNIVYCSLFHAVNNIVPTLAMVVMEYALTLLGGAYTAEAETEAAQMMAQQGIPLSFVGIYILMALITPFGIYLGSYLLHWNTKGYSRSFFAKERLPQLYTAIGATILIFVAGVGIFFWGILLDVGLLSI